MVLFKMLNGKFYLLVDNFLRIYTYVKHRGLNFRGFTIVIITHNISKNLPKL